MCAESCLALCDPMGCNLPGSSVHGLFKQEYWNGFPFPTLGHLPDSGIKPESLALAGGFSTIELSEKPTPHFHPSN